MSDTTEVLRFLKEHKTITDAQARKHIGTTRLGARIHELRSEHNIETTLIPVRKRGGRKAKVAQYELLD